MGDGEDAIVDYGVTWATSGRFATLPPPDREDSVNGVAGSTRQP